jgi:uncharacterized RDD family membrane protein YckC
MSNLPPPPPQPSGQPDQPWQGYQPQGYQQQGYGYSYGGIPAQPAGFWTRFAAAFIDGLIFAIPLNILVVAVPDAAVAFRLIGLAIGVAYYAMLEGGETGQTLGKKALAIRVVDQDTWQPGVGIGRGVGRYFARWLSFLPFLLGYLWMLWDKDKQTFHDKLARTRVIKTG